MMKRRNAVVALGLALGVVAATPPAEAQQPQKKPNILVIWGDDIGQFNISAYNMGMMGYKTPNIDSLASEGALFTTGTASRAAPPAARPSSPASRRSAPAC